MAQAKTGDALWKWILGGIAAGAAVLGLLIGAYAIGYDRGQDNPTAVAPTTPAPPAETEPEATAPETTPTETTPTETTPPPTETQPADTGASEADLVARGEELWSSTGCAGCHSLDGSAGVGPTMQGLAGSTVTLDDGSQVAADDAYLERAIVDPDAQVAEGAQAGIMPGAVASQEFATRPDDVAALVAFIKAQG
ncbi:MAG: cytochrome c [Gaiella sp.]|nr:cytochrome c [Gaiella sp.]